jgi:polygalacturonase
MNISKLQSAREDHLANMHIYASRRPEPSPICLHFTSFLFLSLLLSSSVVFAQDTRHVTEPHIPAACVTLEARIVANHGLIADQDERALDTERIQQAIDGCVPGKAVVLRGKGNKNVFLAGPFQLRSGVTLVVDANTALVASRDPRLYDRAPNSCGILSDRDKRSAGCKPLISGEGIRNSGVMGEGSIDGRGGAKLLGQDVSWWDLAYTAKGSNKRQSVFDLITLHHVNNFTLYKITLRNSPGTHVGAGQMDGFTAWGVKIMTPHGARNSDGMDPGASRNVTIAYCSINNGDDHVTFGAGKGESASNISVLHNHFYAGHGMSIGSGTVGGVDHMLVDDLTIDGADNGIRIKSDRSRGGLVHDIVYRNICMRNVTNPLAITPLYTSNGGDLLPIFKDITFADIHILTAGSYTLIGLDSEHKIGLTFDNVFADDQQHSKILARDAEITIGSKHGNLVPSGDDVTVQQQPGASPGKPLNCDARFVPFPDLSKAPEMAGGPPPVDMNPYVGPGEK